MERGPGSTGTSKGAQTRRAILDAAIARFGREGYRATSVADIAREAAVGGTVAYAYFPNKEALFFAAVDEDAAAVIEEGLDSTLDEGQRARVVGGRSPPPCSTPSDRHPLARRLLGGLEPEVTARLLEIPALEELRKVSAERLGAGQLAGIVRPDIDPASTATGRRGHHAVPAHVAGPAGRRRGRASTATTSPPCSSRPSSSRPRDGRRGVDNRAAACQILPAQRLRVPGSRGAGGTGKGERCARRGPGWGSTWASTPDWCRSSGWPSPSCWGSASPS